MDLCLGVLGLCFPLLGIKKMFSWPAVNNERHASCKKGAVDAEPLSSLQVMYFSSLFPYVVLACFLVRGLLLRGAIDGILHMFTPKVRTASLTF